MKISTLALFLLASLAACGSDDTGGGDDVGGGDDAPPFTDGVSTLSGHADAGYVDGKRGAARFANPVNVAVGPDGTVYVADFDNGKIRAVDGTDGTTTTVISAQGFSRPFALAFSPDGTLYASTDRDPAGQHGPMSGTIWRIDIDGKTATPIAEKIGRPRGLAVLPDGRIAISDYTHHVIQLVDPASGQVTLLAGSWDAKGMVDGVGTSALFSTPYGLVVKDGNLIVADYDNNRLRKVGMNGSVATLAGNGVAGFADGSMDSAQFNKPQGVSITATGDIYVTDLENYRIRRISGSTVETVVGSGTGGYVDSDDLLGAQLFGLEGLAVTADGSMLFVADGGRGENVPYNRIRSVNL
jgi:sugar lactone lactonase YvrE